jgi:hypothetical protein
VKALTVTAFQLGGWFEFHSYNALGHKHNLDKLWMGFWQRGFIEALVTSLNN